MSESKNKLSHIKNFVPNFLTNHSLLPIFSGSNFLLHLIFFRPKNIPGPKIIKRKVWIKSLVDTLVFRRFSWYGAGAAPTCGFLRVCMCFFCFVSFKKRIHAPSRQGSEISLIEKHLKITYQNIQKLLPNTPSVIFFLVVCLSKL